CGSRPLQRSGVHSQRTDAGNRRPGGIDRLSAATASPAPQRFDLRPVRQGGAVALGGGHRRSDPGRTRGVERRMIYTDANVIIRLVEGTQTVRAPLEARLQTLRGTAGFLATSRLSRLESRCKPLRQGDARLLALYDAFFSGVEVVLLEIDAAVVEKATKLRAQFNFKTPDAIHLASAILVGASAFLTADRNLVH